LHEPYALIITVYDVRDWSQGEDFFRFALDKDKNEKCHYSGMVAKISGRQVYYAGRKFREKNNNEITSKEDGKKHQLPKVRGNWFKAK
jgi:hypothetical protein